MNKTGIAWADYTWNPITGCSKVSPACLNCYAEGVAKRFWKDRDFTDVRFHPERLEQPLKLKKPSRIFVNSMSDLFHENLSFENQVAPIFRIMLEASHHTFMILTKRPQRMHDFCKHWATLPNVCLGVTIEDKKSRDERASLLLQTRATIHFVSMEPLLEYVPMKKRDYPLISRIQGKAAPEGGL